MVSRVKVQYDPSLTCSLQLYCSFIGLHITPPSRLHVAPSRSSSGSSWSHSGIGPERRRRAAAHSRIHPLAFISPACLWEEARVFVCVHFRLCSKELKSLEILMKNFRELFQNIMGREVHHNRVSMLTLIKSHSLRARET